MEGNNFAENIFSFTNRHGDDGRNVVIMTDFLRNNFEDVLLDVLKESIDSEFLFQRSREGKTLLYYASKYKLEKFLTAGVSRYPGILSSDEDNVIKHALEFKANDFLYFVIKNFPKFASNVDKEGKNLPSLCAKYRCVKALKLACDDYSREVIEMARKPDKYGKTPRDYLCDIYKEREGEIDEKPRRGFVMGIDEPGDYS